MKYLKTNEGLFSKDEIPKKLIDDIKRGIETKYSGVVDRDSSFADRNIPSYDKDIFDRYIFKTETPIGVVKTILTLRRPLFRTETGWTTSKLSRKIIKFQVFFDGQEMADYDSIELIKWEKIDVGSVLNNIDYVIRRISNESTAKKETEDFYNKISVDEIRDLVADLYDIIGDYEITKTSIKGKKGFQLIFNTNLDFAHKDPNYLPDETFFVARDSNLSILTELNSLGKRLFTGYSLFLIYTFVGRRLKVLIYERKKK